MARALIIRIAFGAPLKGSFQGYYKGYDKGTIII